MTRTVILFLMLLSTLVFFSCKNDEAPPNPQDLIAKGWQDYTTGNYQGAIDKFNQALSMDGNLVDAYNGAGWASAKLNQLANAVSKFTTGLGKDTANLEIKAGLSIVYNAQRNYAQSISYASQVVASRPSWSFSRDLTVSASDLHLLLAENYFAIADYAASLTEVQKLNSVFNTDVGTVAGQTALAQEIERLRGIV